MSGNGGNVVLVGSPEWTNDSITVTPGEVLSLVSIRSHGALSPAAAGLLYLDANGNVLGTGHGVERNLNDKWVRHVGTVIKDPVRISAGAGADRFLGKRHCNGWLADVRRGGSVR